MAFNAQFFQLNPQSNVADDIKSGYETGLGIREAERKKALQDTYSKMLTSAGTLPTEFIQAAANKGLGIEGLTQYFENLKGNVGTAKQVAEDSAMLDMLGRSSDVGREWNGKPTSETITITPVKEIKTEDPDMWGQLNPKWSTNPVKPSDSMSSSPMSDKVIEDEYNIHSGNIATLPPLPKTSEPTIAVTSPKEYSAVEEMLRRKEGNGLGSGLSDFVSAGFKSDNTVWNPKDDNTNQYRMFASALANELSANGYSSAKDYLTKLGESVYNQNLYVPNQMAIYGKDGKLDRAAFGAEKAKYEQSKIVAQAKADEAIMKARNDLTEKANKYGITTADQNKTEIGGNVRLRDSSYRPQASALLTNNVLIDETGKQLRAATGDIQKLSLTAPSVIRAISTASNPGAQLSEGNLSENAQKLATSITDDPNLAMKIVGSILLMPKDGGKALKNLIVSSANMFNPNVFQERLKKMLDEAKLMNDKGLETYTYKPTPADLSSKEETEFKTKDWFNSKPGSVGFESLAGNKYKVIGRDSFNFPNIAEDREGNKYKLIEGRDGIRIEEIVTDDGPNAPSPRKTGGRKTGGKKVDRSSRGM